MLQMIRKYPELLAFGILTAVFSSPGQTFLISLFIPSMRQALGIDTQTMTALYSLSTLASGCLLPLTGKLFDRSDLFRFSVAATLLLCAGCLALAAAVGPLSVFFGFFLVRNLGQGTLSLISTTCMAQLFGPRRGRALGIANLGYPLGEMLLPAILLAWIGLWGWRSGWVFLAALLLFVLIPAMRYLLRHDPHKKAQAEIAAHAEAEYAHIEQPRGMTMRRILKDHRFYLILFPSLLPPAFLTALFFHQLDIFGTKGWAVSLIAGGFVAFGLTRAAGTFFAGPLVDRCSARRVFPLSLLPLGAGMLSLAFGQAGMWSFLYLGLAGLTMGFSSTASAALYAEIFGVQRLGTLRGITSAAMVFVTAAAPLAFAFSIRIFSLPTVLMFMLLLLGGGVLAALQLLRRQLPSAGKSKRKVVPTPT